MRMTGPPKKPTKLKLLEGTYRKSRAVNNEANPEAATPIVPDHLSAEAKAEWGRVCSELEALGLLARIDRAALAAYCHCWADWVEASAMCATGPGGQDRKVIKTVAGNFMENPYYSIVKRSLELMHKFLTEFGMTPASRTRINAEPVSDKPKSGWGTFGK